MCLKAHLLYGGSCQLARVTCASGAGGKPVMSPSARVAPGGLSRAVVGHDAQTNRTRARPAVIYDSAYVAGAGSRGPGRAGHGAQLAGSARQPVGVLARRRPPAHLPGAPRRRPGPAAACRRRPARPARGPGDPDGPDGRAPPVGQHRGRRARRHLHRRLPGAAGRRAGHRVVRPAGRAGPAARADVGVQVRRRLRGRRAHRPRPARPRRRDHDLRARTGRQRLRRRPGPARLRHAQRGQVPARSTPTRTRTSAAWTSGWAGRNRQSPARASPAGSTGSWPRCRPRRRTASGSCTARPSPTCWAGCASARPAGPWPSSSPS